MGLPRLSSIHSRNVMSCHVMSSSTSHSRDSSSKSIIAAKENISTQSLRQICNKNCIETETNARQNEGWSSNAKINDLARHQLENEHGQLCLRKTELPSSIDPLCFASVIFIVH